MKGWEGLLFFLSVVILGIAVMVEKSRVYDLEKQVNSLSAKVNRIDSVLKSYETVTNQNLDEMLKEDNERDSLLYVLFDNTDVLFGATETHEMYINRLRLWTELPGREKQ